MMKRSIVPLLLLLVVYFAAGCAPQAAKPAETQAAAVVPILTAPPREPVPTPTAEPSPDPVEENLSAMTLEEKVGQLLVAGIEGTAPGEDARAAIRDCRVGGVILFSRNVENAGQLAELTNGLKELNGDYVNLFLAVDEEGGRVSRMPGEVTGLSSPYDYIRAGGDPYLRGQALAEACKTFGFNLDFAPVLDVWSNSANTVVGDRAMGTGWDAVAALAADAAAGLGESGVIPVVKHFPGHGDTLADSHKTLPVVDKTLDELEAQELKPFRAAIDAGVPAVMVGHILLRQIDPDYPATLSPAVVTGLLRGELGFDGMVATDDLTMGAISNTYSVGEAAVLAVEAGCDLLLVCHGAENLTGAYEALLSAVGEGRITEARLDESVRRILAVKERYQISGAAVSAPDVAALNEKLAAVTP